MIDKELLSFESDANVAATRAQEKKKSVLLESEKIDQDLIELSRNQPLSH